MQENKSLINGFQKCIEIDVYVYSYFVHLTVLCFVVFVLFIYLFFGLLFFLGGGA